MSENTRVIRQSGSMRPALAALVTGALLSPAWAAAAEPPSVPGDAVIDAPVASPARPSPAAGRVEAWVFLAMPGAITMPARTSVERRVNQMTIESRQSSLLQELAALGAYERGRQSLTRSAVLVEVDEASLARIAQVPGVARVQKVTHLHSTDGLGASPRLGAQPATR